MPKTEFEALLAMLDELTDTDRAKVFLHYGFKKPATRKPAATNFSPTYESDNPAVDAWCNARTTAKGRAAAEARRKRLIGTGKQGKPSMAGMRDHESAWNSQAYDLWKKHGVTIDMKTFLPKEVTA